MRANGVRSVALALFIGATLLACSGKNGSSGAGTGGTGADKGACAPVEAHVRSLYAAEKVDEKVTPEVREELIDANVHMIVRDCETSPDTFMACISKAQDVKTLERDCIVPLDDEGTVEGNQFR